MKTVSVILTTYNSGDALSPTIESIRSQTGQGDLFEIELIVVDDHSTDDTWEQLQTMGLTAHRTPSNSGGPNAGRNIGLTQATGDYICIADHDDRWHADRLSRLLPHLERVPIVTSGHTLLDITSGKEITRKSEASAGHILFGRNKTFLQKLTKDRSGQHSYLGSIIYDRALLGGNHFEEEYGVVDYDWVLRLFHEQESIEVCASLYTRSVDGSNLSLDEEYRIKDFTYSKQYVEQYRSAHPKEVGLGIKRMHGTLARYYYLTGNMRKAREYFLLSGISLKTLGYYCTTFIGSEYVKKKFNIFG